MALHTPRLKAFPVSSRSAVAELMERPQVLFAEPSPTLAVWRCPKIAREAADETLAVVIDLNELSGALIAALNFIGRRHQRFLPFGCTLSLKPP